MNNEQIIFYGDPHGRWDPLFEALKTQPRAVIVLGDLAEGKLDPNGTEKARRAFDAVLERGIGLHFITGNHDNSCDSLWELVEEYDAHRIDGRVIEIDGIRIGGLGGVIRGKLWRGDGEARFDTEEELIARTPRQERWKGTLPRKHLTTIMPWTVEDLRQHQVDVLVTHEAPSNHDFGSSSWTAWQQICRRAWSSTDIITEPTRARSPVESASRAWASRRSGIYVRISGQ
ncbi:metallophosphoesterase family protein [Salipiger mucosus]|uniref:Putative phosphoesterase n=1 Tax=Salipiger mucosus DSM 16094 TaxID=1123237 RepID=S9QVK3_9RHOB|nr:metallophosphoesterase [Salipiger mucosus]EPX83577.1 putative phosphoesterase [Salipiger mucosus DSM 16094]